MFTKMDTYRQVIALCESERQLAVCITNLRNAGCEYAPLETARKNILAELKRVRSTLTN